MTPARCPRCEFAYGWDGQFCTHCNSRGPLPGWVANNRLSTLIRRHPDRGSDRRRMLLLFAAGCVRRAEHLLEDQPVCLELIHSVEWHADEFLLDPNIDELIRAAVLLANRAGAGSPSRAEAQAAEAVNQLGRLAVGTRQTWWSRLPRLTRVHAESPAHLARSAIAISQTHPAEFAIDWRLFPLPPDLEPYRTQVPEGVPFAHALAELRTRQDPVSTATAVLADAYYEQNRRHERAMRCEEALQCDLYRDLFAHPTPLPKLAPRWRTSTVTALARHLYDSRDFSAMPILADALQDAGCEEAEILDHCRSDKPHARGCWVVDLVLGN
jgi:hypothetical protein